MSTAHRSLYVTSLCGILIYPRRFPSTTSNLLRLIFSSTLSHDRTHPAKDAIDDLLRDLYARCHALGNAVAKAELFTHLPTDA